MVLLNAEHISLSWGENTLFDDVSFALEEQDKVGFIGINGTGKSTFLRILAGMQEPDAGPSKQLGARRPHRLSCAVSGLFRADNRAAAGFSRRGNGFC